MFEPLRELVAGTRRISRGDFNVRLQEKRSDEVGLVASAFNEMTERIAESQRALEERRRYLEAILANIELHGRVRTINAAAERVKANGGKILNGPMEVPGGDWVLNALDPQDAAFSLHAKKAQ